MHTFHNIQYIWVNYISIFENLVWKYTNGIQEYNMVYPCIQYKKSFTAFECWPIFCLTWNFNFTVPPEQPEILGYLNASTIALSPDENQLIMSCEVRKGHPAATIEWFRNGNLVVENVRYSSEPMTSGSKLMTARSTITISNIGDHHNSIYMCRAKNDALGNNWMQTFVKLNVLCKTLENLSISI